MKTNGSLRLLVCFIDASTYHSEILRAVSIHNSAAMCTHHTTPHLTTIYSASCGDTAGLGRIPSSTNLTRAWPDTQLYTLILLHLMWHFDITYRLVEISLGCFPNFGSCAFNTSRSTLRETSFHASVVADIWALFLQMSHPHKIILHYQSAFEQTKTQNLL